MELPSNGEIVTQLGIMCYEVKLPVKKNVSPIFEIIGQIFP